MQRKSTFEDFEKLMDDAEASNPPKRESTESERREIEFDSALFRRRSAPKIPANGSELFDDSDGEEAEIYEEVYETRKPIYSHRNTHEFDEAEAEERYRQREARLRKKAEKRRQNRHLGGKILAILQFILSVVFMGLIFKLDVLPTKYFIAASIILILLALICFLLQFRKHAHWAGKIISFIVILVMIFGSVYVAKTIYTLSSVTKVKHIRQIRLLLRYLRMTRPSHWAMQRITNLALWREMTVPKWIWPLPR